MLTSLNIPFFIENLIVCAKLFPLVSCGRNKRGRGDSLKLSVGIRTLQRLLIFLGQQGETILNKNVVGGQCSCRSTFVLALSLVRLLPFADECLAGAVRRLPSADADRRRARHRLLREIRLCHRRGGASQDGPLRLHRLRDDQDAVRGAALSAATKARRA